jgi:hypothetical protein
MGWSSIDAVSHEVATELRVPGQEGFACSVGGKPGDDILDGMNVETANKGTQEESFILVLEGGLDSMTQNLTIIRASSKPWRNQTGIGINDEVTILRVGHVPCPGRATVGNKLLTSTKDGGPTR